MDIFVHATASGFTTGAYPLPGASVWYTVVWDAMYHNWRVDTCTGFKKPPDEPSTSSTTWENGRRLKPTESLGLNRSNAQKDATHMRLTPPSVAEGAVSRVSFGK